MTDMCTWRDKSLVLMALSHTHMPLQIIMKKRKTMWQHPRLWIEWDLKLRLYTHLEGAGIVFMKITVHNTSHHQS